MDLSGLARRRTIATQDLQSESDDSEVWEKDSSYMHRKSIATLEAAGLAGSDALHIHYNRKKTVVSHASQTQPSFSPRESKVRFGLSSTGPESKSTQKSPRSQYGKETEKTRYLEVPKRYQTKSNRALRSEELAKMRQVNCSPLLSKFSIEELENGVVHESH